MKQLMVLMAMCCSFARLMEAILSAPPDQGYMRDHVVVCWGRRELAPATCRGCARLTVRNAQTGGLDNALPERR